MELVPECHDGFLVVGDLHGEHVDPRIEAGDLLPCAQAPQSDGLVAGTRHQEVRVRRNAARPHL